MQVIGNLVMSKNKKNRNQKRNRSKSSNKVKQVVKVKVQQPPVEKKVGFWGAIKKIASIILP
jgi:hypothetical protein